jgi:Protein of unknown function (DUF2511)
VLLASATMVLTAGCGPDGTPAAVPLPSPIGGEQPIARANLAHLWPLTVDSGTLVCRSGSEAVFVADDGTAYALNEQAAQHGYSDIAALATPGAHLGALRSIALRLCDGPPTGESVSPLRTVDPTSLLSCRAPRALGLDPFPTAASLLDGQQ